MEKEEKIYGAITVIIFLVVAFCWHKVWVEPRDQFVSEMIDCTDGDRSREAFDNCLVVIRSDK